MKKKLASLLFCSLFVLQSDTLFPAQAGDIEPDYKALPTDSRRSTFSGYVYNKDEICSRIGDNFVYVYINPDMPSDAQWIIFKSPNNPDGSDGKYICYQSGTASMVSRDQLIAEIADARHFQNFSVCCIDRFLTCRENVVLEVSF